MIEQHGFPSGRLERKFGRRRVALRRAGAGAAALALRERRRRTERDGDAERLQQLPARQPAAIEWSNSSQVGTHRTLLRNVREPGFQRPEYATGRRPLAIPPFVLARELVHTNVAGVCETIGRGPSLVMKTPATEVVYGLACSWLRTIGPPLVVAAVCVVALVWFDKVWIPTRADNFNERDLRALRTISAQIKGRVDNFDLALDHAIDSFRVEGGNISAELRQAVLAGARDRDVRSGPGLGEGHAGRSAKRANPARRGARSLSRLSARGGASDGRRPVSLIARADIDDLAAPYLTRNDFDALLVLDAHGATIAQRSPSGLELTSVEKVRDRAAGPPASTPAGVFERMRGTTNLAVVTIGAADYMLYAQPIQLSLTHDEKDVRQGPEEWTICGLVRLDRFRAASSTIPTTYWLLFGAGLALICFAIPLVKLRVLSPRERLRRFDGVSVAAALFMMMALAAFAALDLYVFGAVVPTGSTANCRRSRPRSRRTSPGDRRRRQADGRVRARGDVAGRPGICTRTSSQSIGDPRASGTSRWRRP